VASPGQHFLPALSVQQPLRERLQPLDRGDRFQGSRHLGEGQSETPLAQALQQRPRFQNASLFAPLFARS
jgi:hypothetical protein